MLPTSSLLRAGQERHKYKLREFFPTLDRLCHVGNLWASAIYKRVSLTDADEFSLTHLAPHPPPSNRLIMSSGSAASETSLKDMYHHCIPRFILRQFHISPVRPRQLCAAQPLILSPQMHIHKLTAL